ncbi:MAG: YidC/Oxa1 family membrane protein insertase [Gammaproteobacteria bacterium]
MSPEQIRPILFLALAFVGMLLWQAWQQDYGQNEPEPISNLGPDGPSVPGVDRATSPALDVPQAPNVEGVDTAVGDGPATNQVASSAGIDVVTDIYRVRINLVGGTLANVDLLQYPVSLEEPNTPFPLLVDRGSKLFMAQSGLVGKSNAPNHYAPYTATKDYYELDDRDEELTVNLTWRGEGVTVTKRYVFKRDNYVIDVIHEVQNDTSQPWTGGAYGQFRRIAPNESRGLGTIYTYTGGVVSSPDKPYEKYDFSDMEDQDLNLDIRGGWIAMIQHYFAGAWIPPAQEEYNFYSKAPSSSQFVLGMVEPGFSVAPGTRGQTAMQLYLGPKVQSRLMEAAPGLERTVDYGWLFFIAEPLYVSLQFIQGILTNWGWSIIVLTMFIKLLFYPLSNASYKSMARMRKLQPKMATLKERFGDDRQKLNQAMMEMYKKEKINPLGGCLPIVVQIPVFISLYWVLLETVELRQAPFMFWLKDLSTHDPFYVLPVLMGISMFAQQRLSPAPPDPIQAKVMMAMPVIFTFFFLFFPSGLVLYWLCNNLLSITQQYYITRRIESGKIK